MNKVKLKSQLFELKSFPDIDKILYDYFCYCHCNFIAIATNTQIPYGIEIRKLIFQIH